MRVIKNSEPVVLKNHRRAVRGRCPICGGKLFRLSPGGGVGMKIAIERFQINSGEK
jgi:hypothetical protein